MKPKLLTTILALVLVAAAAYTLGVLTPADPCYGGPEQADPEP